MLALRMLALLAGLGAASASNSDVCTTASAYDGTASSSISGCSVAGSCDSSGYWICDDVVTMMTNVYASAITACSDDAIAGSTVTEADYTQLFSSSCCSDGAGPCDPDHSVMCADPTQYDGSASTALQGCTPGSSICDSAGYWTCDGAADYLSISMSSTWEACSTDVMDDDSSNPTSEAQYTCVARAAHARQELRIA